MKPLVSIIVPIFRTNIRYVKDCLSSVLNQSYPHERLELVIFEEGSSEKYSKKIDNLLKGMGSIEVLCYENKNQTSLAHSRNEAIKMSKGDFIFLLDSDDFLHPDAVTKCVEKMVEGIDFVYTNHLKVSVNLSHVIHERDKCIYQNYLYKYKNTIFNPFLHATFVFHGQMFRKNAFYSIGGFREDLFFGEEVEFHLRIDEICRRVNFHHSSEYLYFYRNNPLSICHQHESYSNLIKNIETILVEGAQRRGFDVQKAIRIGRAKPTNAAHYALYDSSEMLIKFPHLDYKTLLIE